MLDLEYNNGLGNERIERVELTSTPEDNIIHPNMAINDEKNVNKY